ncbi:hydantoinase B/oxoprolinase family protein [Bradyrhizobium sp. CCGUVB1N3]|uniref:hydantoinase B/oxoprolinase family protein n=1 Tax=Bradyrhizobium sp. CCGUVB1N3 TaxID=2949629 RepID=UPI0020B36C54|nr:hydantoinase B/oxoprolinase family protein [Bradyrhizobium sp. CCGUVB1N3]MCP3469033.1 hydantoinase B/oxoprolinase family protein [Bradyrhizobium sp. CCGUVB1N3]
MTEAGLDPITLEILWNGLRSTTDECFLTIQRSAFSTNIKERHDHSVAILDGDGRLVVQAENALPIHLASMSGLVEILKGRFAGDIGPGDIFVGNDPHVAGGTHLPDINLAAPVFIDGKLVAFVCNIAHHADVGGAARGSMSGGLTEIYQEGLRIPVVRLYRAGELVGDIFDLLLLNMRLPTERKGDLNAQIAACRLGVERLHDLCGRYGLGKMETAFDEIIERSRTRMRSAIAALPDGEWSNSDVMDDDGAGQSDIAIALTVRKRGTEAIFDFTGSAGQVAGNINLTLNAVRSSVCYALKALLDPSMPNNEGVVQAFEIVAPLGTIVNCVAPAAVALRANTCQRVIDVVLGALANVLPERAIGCANGANTSMVFAGTNPQTGQPYVYLETLGGGMGARNDRDGKDGVQVHITNTSNLPVEAIEMEYPLRVEEYGLVADSGGAGTYRGGLGLRRVVRPVGHTCEFSGVGERFRHAPGGVFGGEPGRPGRFQLHQSDGCVEPLPPKPTGMKLTPEVAVSVETPGAGGYGPPKDRSPISIAEDVAAGKYSASFIQRHYQESSGSGQGSDPQTRFVPIGMEATA